MKAERIVLGESFDGCPHFEIEIQLPEPSEEQCVGIKLMCKDPQEKHLLQQVLSYQCVTKHGKGLARNYQKHQVFVGTSDEASITCPQSGIIKLQFGGKLVGEFKYNSNTWEFMLHNPIMHPESRMMGEYGKTLTQNSLPVSAAASAGQPARRIDGHTHFISAFPMKAALEKSLQPGRVCYIPSLVVLYILKSQGILTDSNTGEWLDFLNMQKCAYGEQLFGKQKDASADLVKEDFKTIIPKLSKKEQVVCLHEGKMDQGYYLKLADLKAKLEENEQWGNFCNGFDLPTTHRCDFTNDMEMAYNLRNWFGKDSYFLEAQLETLYEEYEKQGIDYAEIPAGFFKKPAELEKFIVLTKEIDKKRGAEGKKTIILRPSLSIARLSMPAEFRRALLDVYIPLIILTN